jgi:transcriptional regulator with XRE-family HTH domain
MILILSCIYDTGHIVSRENMMRKLSLKQLAYVLKMKRNEQKLTQEQLSNLTGINRAMIGRIEKEDFIPSITQLENLSKTLDFDISQLFYDEVDNASFAALRSENLSEEEKEGVEALYTMILALQQQIMLSKALRHE